MRSLLSFVILFLVFVIVIIAAIVVISIKRKKPSDSTNSDQKPWPLGVNANFLSAAEKSFFGVLTQLVGNQYLVCPKVSLSDVIFIQKGVDNSTRQTLFNRISRKHLDFVLLDLKTLAPVFAIELDDNSHQSLSAQQRDSVKDKALQDAGLRLIRVPAKHTYSINDIRDVFSLDNLSRSESNQRISDERQEPDILSHTDQANQVDVPYCSKCKVKMVERKASKGKHSGQSFWGCPNYPHCRETIQKQG